MSKRVRAGLLGLSVLVALYVLLGGLLGQTAGEGAYRQLGVFSEVLAHIKSYYVEEPDVEMVTRGALHGLLESLDPYSSYLSPREFEAYQQLSTPQAADVGLVLSKRFGLIGVVAALPDSYAGDFGTGSANEIAFGSRVSRGGNSCNPVVHYK